MQQMKVSQSELAKAVGVSQPVISALLADGGQNSKHLYQIARFLKTNVEYLNGQTDNADFTDLSEPSPALIAEQLGSVMIPEMDISYSMGNGVVIADHANGEMRPFPRDWLRPLIAGSFDQVFIARAEGDSMMPTLLDGDIVIVDTAQKTIDRQDRLWALAYGDLGMIKRVRKMADGGYQINSDNPAVSAFNVYDDEMHAVGRVVWIGRKM